MSVEGLEAIVRTARLPSPPAVALRVIELGEDPEVNIAALAEAVSADPALAAKILKTANSALFSRGNRIARLDRAMLMLGLVPSRLLVLTFSLVDHYRERRPGHFDYGQYWRRAVCSSVLAKRLASEYVQDVEEYAFIAGLLMDIGMLALAECDPVRYEKVWALHARSGLPLHELEEELLNTNHAEVGGYLLGRWNLPVPVTLAIRHHHQPAAPAPAEPTMWPLAHLMWPLVRLLYFSAAMVEAAACVDPAAADSSSLATQAAEYFGTSAEVLGQLIDQAAAQAREMADALCLSGAPELDPVSLLTRARDLLFAEAWRAQQASGQSQAG